MGEVATGTEDHQAVRRNDAFLSKSNPEGIGDRGAHGAQASDAGLDPETSVDSLVTDGISVSDVLCCQPNKKGPTNAVSPDTVFGLKTLGKSKLNRFQRASGQLF